MGALVEVRKAFVDAGKPMTVTDLIEITNLKASKISMALCHLKKHKYLSRKQVERKAKMGRRVVWEYQYHADRSAGA